MKSLRNSNFELLRIICMFLIIAHHYAVHGGWEASSLFVENGINYNYIFIQILGSGGQISCLVFALMTGYFMIDKNINYKKIIIMILEMFFYSILIMIILYEFNLVTFRVTDFVKSLFPIFYGNWFLIFYIKLYILIPYINKALKNLSRKNYFFLIIILLILFNIIPTFIPSSAVPCSMYSLLIMYIIGGYIKTYSPTIFKIKRINTINMVFSILTIISSIVFIDVMAIIFDSISIANKASYFTSIYSIVSVWCAISLFNFFSNIKIESKIINYVSSSIMAVYLIHDNFLMRKLIWLQIFPNMNYLNSKYLFVHAILKIICVFFICVLIDKIKILFCKKTMNKIANKIYNSFKKIKNNIVLRLSVLEK